MFIAKNIFTFIDVLVVIRNIFFHDFIFYFCFLIVILYIFLIIFKILGN